MKLKSIVTIAHHRNGVSGAPFDVVLFTDTGEGKSRKVAILFDSAGFCAVLDVAKLAAGDIAFGSNSWRGDDYEPPLRQVVQMHHDMLPKDAPADAVSELDTQQRLREAAAWLATAAEDLDAAVDGVTEEFNAERTELLAACRNARSVLSGTILPKQPSTKE